MTDADEQRAVDALAGLLAGLFDEPATGSGDGGTPSSDNEAPTGR